MIYESVCVIYGPNGGGKRPIASANSFSDKLQRVLIYFNRCGL